MPEGAIGDIQRPTRKEPQTALAGAGITAAGGRLACTAMHAGLSGRTAWVLIDGVMVRNWHSAIKRRDVSMHVQPHRAWTAVAWNAVADAAAGLGPYRGLPAALVRP